MFPSIPTNQIKQQISPNYSDNTTPYNESNNNSNTTIKQIPLIPPKIMHFDLAIPLDTDSFSTWYIVQTPREVKGIGGPYSIARLREMYRLGDIKDSTLIWEEGEDNWKQLRYHHLLRPKLINFPEIPPKVNVDGNESVDNDPISHVPQKSIVQTSKYLPTYKADNSCGKCGNFATKYLPSINEENIDLHTVNVEIGSTELATEIIPSFLWIGNFASSKISHLNKLVINLSINCTVDLPNPKDISLTSHHCRVKTIPLVDKPMLKGNEINQKQVDKFMEVLSKVYNWIEYERIYPNRIVETKAKSDEAIKQDILSNRNSYVHKKMGYVDSNYNPISAIPKTNNPDKNSSRILVWSKTGNDRACVVAIAYIIKRFGIRYDKAINLVKKIRSHMHLSPFYLILLQKWSDLNTLGDLLCNDCIKLSEDNSNGLIENIIEEDRLLYDPIYENNEILGDPKFYLEKVLIGRQLSSPWTGLCDLYLPNRKLGDEIIMNLFKSLVYPLHIIDLNNNNITANSLSFILHLNNPAKHPEVIYINLSNNNFNKTCGNYISAFLCENNSLHTLDISNCSIGDEGCSYILNTFIRPAHSYFNNSVIDDDDDDDLDDTNSRHTLARLTLRNPNNNRNTIGSRKAMRSVTNSSSNSSIKSSDSPKDQSNTFNMNLTLSSRNLMNASINSEKTMNSSINELYNYTLTDLNISQNNLSKQSCDKLYKLLRKNDILIKLTIDCNTTISNKDMKYWLSSCRIYNTTLQCLSIAYTPLTISVHHHLVKVLTGQYNIIESLNLSNCKLTSDHMEAFSKCIYLSKCLKSINLSNNPIGDNGMKYLIAGLLTNSQKKKYLNEYLTDFQQTTTLNYTIDNDVDISNQTSNSLFYIPDFVEEVIEEKKLFLDPPIEKIDLSNCKITSIGVFYLFICIRKKLTIRYIDISNNNINASLLDSNSLKCLESSNIDTLIMNSCNINTTSCINIFNILNNNNEIRENHININKSNKIVKSIRESLLSISLSNNQINLSYELLVQLKNLIDNNYYLQYIDISYNVFTSNTPNDWKSISATTISNSSYANKSQKLLDLYINFMNDNDIYMYDIPYRSKSKNLFKFGVNSSIHDLYNNGYSHIPQLAREQFMARKREYIKYLNEHPVVPINFLP